MKIKVNVVHNRHALSPRKCVTCGKLFIKYHKGKVCCSNECERLRSNEWRNDYNKKLKSTPEGAFKCRRATILKREQARRERYLAELPRLREAVLGGDDILLNYLLENWTLGASKRNKKYIVRR